PKQSNPVEGGLRRIVLHRKETREDTGADFVLEGRPAKAIEHLTEHHLELRVVAHRSSRRGEPRADLLKKNLARGRSLKQDRAVVVIERGGRAKFDDRRGHLLDASAQRVSGRQVR